SITDCLPWILGALGVALVTGSIWWYWYSSREIAPARKTTNRGRRSSSITRSQTETSTGHHCHQCGKRAAKNDRFCRVCGTKLRID
ncbi:MAG: zinc ribbon domain-containing protein, partial [Chloroflexi bacterium]|nr:zinc ribbon domain-containing protein [Chloroflexota bacterium]